MKQHYLLSLTILAGLTGINAFGQTGEKRERLKQDEYFYIRDIRKQPVSETSAVSTEQWRELAEWYMNMKDFENADKAYSNFINEKQATAEDLYGYVLTLKSQGKYSETIPYMKRMREKAPKDLRVKHFFETYADLAYLKKPSDDYRIDDLDINNPHNTMLPQFYYKKQVAFLVSQFKPGTVYKYKPKEAEAQTDVSLGKPKSMTGEAWDKKTMNGPFSFAKNGKMVAVQSIDFDGTDEDGKHHSDILISNQKQKAWLPADYFTWCDSTYKYSVGQPALNKQGTMMYFVSDMPGGYGGTDIWVSTKTGKNSWSKPINLGDKINTEGDEMFPFIDGNTGFLYFSSDGHNGLGGLDVYEAEMKDSCLCSYDVRNLGSPINSVSDDYGFIFNSKHTNGYFTSNRVEGMGGADIFKFIYTSTKNPSERSNYLPSRRNGGRLAYGDGNFTYGGNSEGNGRFGGNESAEGNGSFRSDGSADGNGEFGNYESGANGSFRNGVYGEGNGIFPSGAEGSGMKFIVFNSGTGKVIPKTDLTFEGKTYQTDGEGQVIIPMNDKTKGEVSVEALGYMPRYKNFYYKGRGQKDSINLDVAVGKHIILRNIYYDFDKSEILPEAANELDKLVAFLKANPELICELSSHTDSRGADDYNMKLSENRAQAAVKYIVTQGIDASRITGKGYGETRLLNECANGIECTEAQHRQNRRTEIFIPSVGKGQNVKQTKGKYSENNTEKKTEAKVIHKSETKKDAKPKEQQKPVVSGIGTGTVIKKMEEEKFDTHKKALKMSNESEDDTNKRTATAKRETDKIHADEADEIEDFSEEADEEEKAFMEHKKRMNRYKDHAVDVKRNADGTTSRTYILY